MMIDRSAGRMQVRQLLPVVSDEKPSGGGKNRGPLPLEHILIGLCARVNVSTARMADKTRFEYEHLETFAVVIL